MNNISKIISVIPNNDFSLTVTFDDKFKKRIEMLPFIKNGISSALSDIEYFKKVKVIDGYIAWENGYDCCPKHLRDL